MTPWLWVYCPLRIEAREGPHSGCAAKARVKLSPRLAMRSGRRGSSIVVGTSRSSVTTRTMLGRAARGVAVGAGAGAEGEDPPPHAAKSDRAAPTHALADDRWTMERQSSHDADRASTRRTGIT